MGESFQLANVEVGVMENLDWLLAPANESREGIRLVGPEVRHQPIVAGDTDEVELKCCSRQEKAIPSSRGWLKPG